MEAGSKFTYLKCLKKYRWILRYRVVCIVLICRQRGKLVGRKEKFDFFPL